MKNLDKPLSYEELMDLALQHYNEGGDATFECVDRWQFDKHVEELGPITTRIALQIFHDDLQYEIEESNLYNL